MPNSIIFLSCLLSFQATWTNGFRFAPKALNKIPLSIRQSNTQISASTNAQTDLSKSFRGNYNYPPLTQSDTAKALLRPEFPSVQTTDTVATAVVEMNQSNRGSVIVLNEDKTLAGIFTERDFVGKILAIEDDATTRLISEVMTPVSVLITATEDTPLSDCRQILLQNRVRHLPILDAKGFPKGVISMRDIVMSLQADDFRKSSARFSGDSLVEIQEQLKDEANLLASTESTGKQDILRAGFVIASAVVGGALLQGDWVHNHEYLSMSATFFLGYVGIIFENYFGFNKGGIALLMSTALWVIYAGTAGASGVAIGSALTALGEKVSEVSEVVYFILGAMTIVEVVDSHQGFKVVTDSINADNKRGLLRVIALLTFFMSAILDNLTTTIVMVSLMKKLLPVGDDRKIFGALIVIAANAGGAWTPIGDVTTTMLWINGQISALPTMTGLLLPSLVSTLISLAVLERQLPEDEEIPPRDEKDAELAPRGKLVFGTGILGLLSVPVFKALTGLPPYLGMLAALGVMWSLTDSIHAGEREELTAPAALKKIDTSGVLFFLGILLSVGAMDSAGILRNLAEVLDKTFPNESIVATLIGLFSALIDNVPLVAATMGMYDLSQVPMDASLWQLIAFCAGTGGSILVIGSAAGVALMGLEEVDFVWYAKRVSVAALAGYLTGIGVYLGQEEVVKGFVANAATMVGSVGAMGIPFIHGLPGLN